jgi:hypothetical protein
MADVKDAHKGKTMQEICDIKLQFKAIKDKHNDYSIKATEAGLSDKKKICKDCNEEFVLTAGEQLFFADKQMPEPGRCRFCRKVRRNKADS